MTSTELIEAANQKYKDLEHKGWEWRSFYNGFLEGATWFLGEAWHKFPEQEPPRPGLYLVIKADKGHGVRYDRMRWYPFDPAIHLESIRKETCGWSGNYGRSVIYWREIPDPPMGVEITKS